MGDVWLATDTRAERPVALKFIKPHLLADPGFRARFLNEARTLGRLEHDRIVTLYSVLESSGHLALVLRFIDGRSLADRIDGEGALPLDAVLACARDILPALGFAHERGTIHRDIKSQNVLVDRQGRSFLTDFGIAVGDLAQRSTMTGVAIGTPHYMSPEQIQTPRALTAAGGGHRSDIYSFGVVLFEMLTGKLPFGGDSGLEDAYRIQHAHCVEQPPSPRAFNADVTTDVEAVVLRCLAKDPADRPESCTELLRQLEAAAAGTPVSIPVKPRAARAATVVEGATPAPEPLKPAPPRPPVQASRSRSVPKTVWLAIGAAAIVGAISMAVIGREDPPPAVSTTRPDPPREQEQTVKAAEPPVSQPPAQEPPPPVVQTSREIPRQPAPQAPAVNPRAERLFREANVLFKQGEYCTGKDKIDEALELDPQNRNYLKLQRDLTLGCNGVQ